MSTNNHFNKKPSRRAPMKYKAKDSGTILNDYQENSYLESEETLPGAVTLEVQDVYQNDEENFEINYKAENVVPPLPTFRMEDIYDYSIFPIVEHEGKRFRYGYKKLFPENYSNLQIEMWCAGTRLSVKDGGIGEFQHLKNIMQMLFPYLKDEWHHWCDMMVGTFSDKPGTYTWLGGGGIGKSWWLGTLAKVWQACNPLKRGVMIINTTQKSQTERAWRYVIDASQAFGNLFPGSIVGSKDEPRLVIYKEIPHPTRPGHVLYEEVPSVGIISQTVKKGSSAAATADLKGMHPQELLVIVEESNHMNRTHLERARGNWLTNRYYKIVLTGNPEIEDQSDGKANMDALYYFSEPATGFQSIEWGKDRWWFNKFGGKTYHFDPYDSPRIREPERFKYSVWLPDRAYIEKKAEELGGENTAIFKQQIRGVYDLDALPFTPITSSMCLKFRARARAKFTGMNRMRWAGFDPAYSGRDEAFLKIAETGITEAGKFEIDFLGEATNFSFKIDAESGDEPSFQMLNWVSRILTEWQVPFENFIMDANIIGTGLGDIFSRHLSKKINKVIVAGPPTERILSLAEDKLTGQDRCANRQTEMWIAMQQLIICEQIRGLDDSIINQLILMRGEIQGKKLKMMEKREYKKQFGFSPDRAEACLFIVDLIRTRGLEQLSKPDYGSEIASDLGTLGLVSGNGMPLRPEDIFVDMTKSNPYQNSYQELEQWIGGSTVQRTQKPDPIRDVFTEARKIWGPS